MFLSFDFLFFFFLFPLQTPFVSQALGSLFLHLPCQAPTIFLPQLIADLSPKPQASIADPFSTCVFLFRYGFWHLCLCVQSGFQAGFQAMFVFWYGFRFLSLCFQYGFRRLCLYFSVDFGLYLHFGFVFHVGFVFCVLGVSFSLSLRFGLSFRLGFYRLFSICWFQSRLLIFLLFFLVFRHFGLGFGILIFF